MILGGVAAVVAWLGWFSVAPALGLPSLATAAMVNRDIASEENPSYWVGWLVVLVGLGAAVVAYLFVTKRLFGSSTKLGLLYGLGLWLVAGAVVMPILAWGAPDPLPPPPLPPGTMHASFMMLDFSNWALVTAAVAWLLFGAILGAVSARVEEEPA
jgi:hypothetical protein